MKKIIITLLFIIFLNSCNTQEQNLDINKNSQNEKHDKILIKKEKKIEIIIKEKSEKIKQEKIKQENITITNNNKVENKVTVNDLIKKYKNGKEVENNYDYITLLELFGLDKFNIDKYNIQNSDILLQNTYLIHLNNYLIFQECSAVYGDCINYFYNINNKKIYYAGEILNFNAETTDLSIGKILPVTKNKTDIEERQKELFYIKGYLDNSKVRINFKGNNFTFDKIKKYFKDKN